MLLRAPFAALVVSVFCGAVLSLCEAVLAQEERKYARQDDVVYSRAEGVELKLDAFLPRTEGPHPAVLVIHGGAWRLGSKGQLQVFAIKLAEKGYATFAINYRLAPKHKYPAQIEDCRAAVRWLLENARKHGVDASRVGAFGYSAGGHLAALLGVQGVPDVAADKPDKQPDPRAMPFRLKAVVAGGAPCDLRVFPPASSVLEYWLGSTRADKPEIYDAASPIAHISRAASPIFFFHGEKDALVNLNTFGPRRTVESLKAAGVETDLHVISGAEHVIALFNPTAFQKSVEFLDKHLKGKVEETK
jgi:triacylglycerol lipase